MPWVTSLERRHYHSDSVAPVRLRSREPDGATRRCALWLVASLRCGPAPVSLGRIDEHTASRTVRSALLDVPSRRNRHNRSAVVSKYQGEIYSCAGVDIIHAGRGGTITYHQHMPMKSVVGSSVDMNNKNLGIHEKHNNKRWFKCQQALTHVEHEKTPIFSPPCRMSKCF